MLHKIEIDGEVLNALKNNADPFIDTSPNDVLRKLLLSHNFHTNKPSFPSADLHGPTIPAGVPVALQQILEVIYYVIKRGYTRIEATKTVAKMRKRDYQTIIDKYCRQLDKKAYEIDKLLHKDLTEFQSVLKSSFPEHCTAIDEFFLSITSKESGKHNNPRPFRDSIKLDIPEQEIKTEINKLRGEWERNI